MHQRFASNAFCLATKMHPCNCHMHTHLRHGWAVIVLSLLRERKAEIWHWEKFSASIFACVEWIRFLDQSQVRESSFALTRFCSLTRWRKQKITVKGENFVRVLPPGMRCDTRCFSISTLWQGVAALPAHCLTSYLQIKAFSLWHCLL